MRRLAWMLIALVPLAAWAATGLPFAELLEKAEKGEPAAQCDLGVAYEEGKLVEKNPVEAVRWFTLAAAQGFSRAQNLLGRCYAKGHGTKRDLVRAYMWMTLAVLSVDGDGGETGSPTREELAAKMSPAQLAEAASLVEKWKAEPGDRTPPAN